MEALFELGIEQSSQCAHCGKTLASTNRSGYCTKHNRPCDRVVKRLCQQCGKRLRSDCPDDRCVHCRVSALSLAEPQFCRECGKKLRSDNDSGYCPTHHYLSRGAYRWAVCKEPGCGDRVRHDNDSGYCRKHRYAGNRPSVEPQFCKRCAAELPSDNKSGYCPKHIFLKYRPPKDKKLCSYEGCTEPLGFNNESGLCGAHYNVVYASENREAAAKRQRDFRARQLARLQELERIAAQYPPDWTLRSIDWRIVGMELLSEEEYISNEELAERLDRSRLLQCPYAETWKQAERARDSKGRDFMVYVNRIRKWVGKPGKEGGRISA